MKQPFSVILIAVASDFQNQSGNPSLLLKHYHLTTMLPAFQKKISKGIDVDDLEKHFLNPISVLEDDLKKINNILGMNDDIDIKVKKLVFLHNHNEVHHKSKGYVLRLIGQLLFANEQWFNDHPDDAAKLFPNQEFNARFFDNRRNLVCLFVKKH